MRTEDEIINAILNEEPITEAEGQALMEISMWGPAEPPKQGPLRARRHGLSWS